MVKQIVVVVKYFYNAIKQLFFLFNLIDNAV